MSLLQQTGPAGKGLTPQRYCPCIVGTGKHDGQSMMHVTAPVKLNGTVAAGREKGEGEGVVMKRARESLGAVAAAVGGGGGGAGWGGERE